MKNSDYWKLRFRQMEQSQHDTSAKKYNEIQRQLDKSQVAIESRINAWYGRYATNNGISIAEARKQLTAAELKELKWDIKDYIKYGQDNAINGKWAKELENASAKAHISRLEAIKLQIQCEGEKLYGNLIDDIDKHIVNTFQDAYYHTAYEIQKGVGVGSTFAAVNMDKVQAVIHKPWAVDEKNFVTRLGEDKAKLINSIHNSLTQMCLTGDNPKKMVSQLASTMQGNKARAGRILRTESAYFSQVAQKQCFNELGVEQFKIVATLDSRTSETCQGKDGQHYPMKIFEAGVTAPPFHPNCRCCTAPYFDDEFSMGERAARDENGKTYYVPANTTYEEWKRTFVDGDNKSKLKENLSEEQIAERIKELKAKQRDLSSWGDYDTVVKDWGSVDDYFEDGDDKELFLKYQKEIENLIMQKNKKPKLNNIVHDDILDAGKRIPMSIVDALKGVNPNFSQNTPYSINCQRCVQAYELRRRGYDVEALPKPSGKKDIIEWGNECFIDSNGNKPDFVFHQSEKDIGDTLTNSPDGSRYVIYVQWKYSRATHVFIAEKENGIIRYVDPQINESNVENYLYLGKRNGFAIFRIDDKDITTDGAKLKATVKGWEKYE